ncbi:MAG: hypothetical protein HY721_27620, partial [Planctomycetes bacterium]|nr:hypothetical protein [Planctomycetota bacterium]
MKTAVLTAACALVLGAGTRLGAQIGIPGLDCDALAEGVRRTCELLGGSPEDCQKAVDAFLARCRGDDEPPSPPPP